MPKRYYVYTLSYPESMGGAVFYVGKGAGNRVHQHESEAKNGGTYKKDEIIRAIWDAGEQVVKSIVLETDDDKEARKHEKKLIELYAPTLANVVANPLVVREKMILSPQYDPSTEEYFQRILERTLQLNSSLAERHPADQREAFLAEANTQSKRDLRRKQARGWR